MENTGRAFSVRPDGTLVLLAQSPDVDFIQRNGIARSKPPMKVILPRSSAEAIKAQLKYPAGRMPKNNINDSMNLRDFVEYGGKSNTEKKSRSDNVLSTPSYDVRKWC